MLKKEVMLGFGVVLLVMALAAPSFAATIKVTDGGLEPATVTVKKGEEVVWVDATSDRSAHVALEFGIGAGVQTMVDKSGGLRVRFEKPGAYEYGAHVGIGGGAHPHEIRGRIVVK